MRTPDRRENELPDSAFIIHHSAFPRAHPAPTSGTPPPIRSATGALAGEVRPRAVTHWQHAHTLVPTARSESKAISKIARELRPSAFHSFTLPGGVAPTNEYVWINATPSGRPLRPSEPAGRTLIFAVHAFISATSATG